MKSKIAFLVFAFGAVTLGAQDISKYTNLNVGGKTIQFHGFMTQGFGYSDDNNYLTMDTSKGSFAMTDAGTNASVQLTDSFRIGAQGYVRNFGHLGAWHAQLDWAYADYRFKPWFGVRGGKVKTAMGLFNDTQDNDSLHTFALLPQSVYPTDLRDATIGHIGGDVYGNVEVKRLGSFAYTVYAGQRKDTADGGYLYLVRNRGINMNDYGGLQYGADLKWTMPVKGLLAGASHLSEDITGKGTGVCTPAVPVNCAAWNARTQGHYEEHSKKDYADFLYGEYTRGNLRLDAEHRRYWRDQEVFNDSYEVRADTRGWYASGSYRFTKHLEFGSYYSRFTCSYIRASAAPVTDTSLPANHVYDKVVTARIDLTNAWVLKIEGHFMNGYGSNQSPDGFYSQVNPSGFKPNTTLLLVRTGWSF